MFWRPSEFHHILNVVWPLKVGAVDEEQRLLYSSLQQVSVDGYHPTVHGYATPEREGERERKGYCYHNHVEDITSPLIPLWRKGVVTYIEEYLCSLTGISGLH